MLNKSFNFLPAIWKNLSKKRKREFKTLFALSIASSVSEVVNIGAIIPFIGFIGSKPVVFNHNLVFFGHNFNLSHQSLVLYFGFFLILLIAISAILRCFTVSLQLRLSEKIGSDIASIVFTNILNRQYLWHIENNSAVSLGLITKDTDQAIAVVRSVLVFTVNSLLSIFILGVLFWISPIGFFVSIVFIGSIYSVTFKFTRANLRIEGREVTYNYQKSLQVAQESLGGIRDLIIENSHSYFLATFDYYYEKQRAAFAGIQIKNQLPRYIVEGFSLIFIVGAALIIFVFADSPESILGVFISFVLGAYRVLQPAQQCFVSVGMWQANKASTQKLLPFLDNYCSLDFDDTIQSEQDNKSSLCNEIININDLSFSYPGSPIPSLNHISLSIERGDRVAIVGRSGSGKSTVVDIMLGLLPEFDGSLVIEGLNVKDPIFNIRNWHSILAHVPQTIYLSDSSVYSNIAFGVDEHEIDKELVWKAARMSHSYEFIQDLPCGFDTIVGESGLKLSGGQRQRLGVARALYKMPNVLILDEATSALDEVTERQLMQSIYSVNPDITIIMISHRLSTIRNCNKVVEMDKGIVVFSGDLEEFDSRH